jgi:hypothetical protein
VALKPEWTLIAILLTSVAAICLYHDRQTASLQSGLPLKLSVTENRNQLDVTWNRTVPAIVYARRGVLSIMDGPVHQYLELTGEQLRTGKVHYAPVSGDVKLRLEVFSEGQKQVGESIRAFNEATR